MEEKKIGIVDLPPELLGHIFEYLGPEEICKLSQICKSFHSTSHIESIWQKKCSELPIPRFSIQNDQLSFRQIYTKVLYKYWKLLGFWRRNVRFYGGLLHVKFDSSSGRIIGTDLTPAFEMHANDLMSRKPAFCVVPDLEQNSSRLAYCAPQASGLHQHFCQIDLGKLVNGKVVEFRTECFTPIVCNGGQDPCWLDDDGASRRPLPPAFHVDGGMTLLRNFFEIRSYKQRYGYSRLEWPLAVPGAIIQPGLFKSDYGRHGVELIMLTYVDERTVEGVKVTGDRDVPFGQVSFRANLLEAFVMNVEDQAHISQLMAAEPLSPPIPTNQLPEQLFRIPDQVFTNRLNLPNVCKARFSGVMQFASDGYTNSSFVPGHWIVFNEDLFAFIRFRPKRGFLFHRVQEQF